MIVKSFLLLLLWLYFLALGLGYILVIWRDVAASLFPVNYDKYIRSARWKRKASAMRRRADYRCEECGSGDWPLEVHHLTYARLGYEWAFDLVVLCNRCHEKRHGIG